MRGGGEHEHEGGGSGEGPAVNTAVNANMSKQGEEGGEYATANTNTNATHEGGKRG
jgi:hypothetical protein